MASQAYANLQLQVVQPYLCLALISTLIVLPPKRRGHHQLHLHLLTPLPNAIGFMLVSHQNLAFCHRTGVAVILTW